jgi:hypothetical protein
MPHDHRCARWSAFKLPHERAHTHAPFRGYAHETIQISPQRLFLQEHCSGRLSPLSRPGTKTGIQAHGKFWSPLRRTVHHAVTRGRTDARNGHRQHGRPKLGRGLGHAWSAAPINDRIASPASRVEAAVELASQGARACSMITTLRRQRRFNLQRPWAVRTLMGRDCCNAPSLGRALSCEPLHTPHKAKYRPCFAVVCDVQHCAAPARLV